MAARLFPISDFETGEWRLVPWSEHRQDDWPWSLEVLMPVLRGESVDRAIADQLAVRLGNCQVEPKDSEEDKRLAAKGPKWA